MIRFLYKKSYKKAFVSLMPAEQEIVISADKKIREFYTSGKAPYGLRIKKLHDDRESQVFEGRVGLSLRILWTKQKDRVAFEALGNHDAVRKFLKNL